MGKQRTILKFFSSVLQIFSGPCSSQSCKYYGACTEGLPFPSRTSHSLVSEREPQVKTRFRGKSLEDLCSSSDQVPHGALDEV